MDLYKKFNIGKDSIGKFTIIDFSAQASICYVFKIRFRSGIHKLSKFFGLIYLTIVTDLSIFF